MIRLRSMLVCAGLSVGLLTAAAQALPPVIERVPDDAMAVVAIPAPAQLEKNVNALKTAIDQPIDLPSIKNLLESGGLTTGVDETKSMAVVLFAPEKKGKAPGEKEQVGEIDRNPFIDDEERMVFLIPITSYADFLKNFNVEPAGAGKVDPIEMPGAGEPGYAKDIGGGYAAIGPIKSLVESYTGKPGDNSFKKRMGKAGESLADASDVVLLVNMDQTRPMAEEGVKEMRKAAKDQMSALGQDADANMALANWLSETVIRDTTFAVGGVKLSASGIALDMVGQFKPDSYLAKTFAAKGDASPLLGKLPVGPYLFAFAMDTSAAPLKQFYKDINSRNKAFTGDAAKKIAEENLEITDGQSGVVGFPMGGAIAGVLTSTVMYSQSSKPAELLEGTKKAYAAMDGQSANGVTIKTQVKEPGTAAGDAPYHSWSMSFETDGSNQMEAQNMAFIFGAEGRPAGYMAKSDTGMYTTFARNSDLMANALKVGKGVEPLGKDPLLLGVQEQLPKNRISEGYLGVKSILDLGLPFAAMMGVSIPADKIPEKLPPVGVALSSDEGAARFSIFVPSPIIKTGNALYEAFDMQDDGMNGGEDAPAGRPRDGGTGQPRF